jgi:phenylacetate-CoA ligase
MPIWNVEEECLDREERAQRQLEGLQSTLNRAYKNVPYYRKRFREEGIEPSNIESLQDLGRIPFTMREHFSENYPYGLFAVPLRDVVRIHTSRGTLLKPTVSGYTRQDLVVWREMAARSLAAANVSNADILQIDLGPGLINWGRDYQSGAEAIEAGVIPMTILPPEKQLMILRDYRTTTLVTTPSAAMQLTHLLFRANLNPNALALKMLILVGEAPDMRIRAQLSERLHLKTWVHYGLSEVPGPALAFECEEGQGLHISEDHFLPEVIDPETGNVLPEETDGELVLTTLTTRALPLIRFRTGDRVRLISSPCPCGRTLKRIEWLSPRTDEILVIRGVKVQHRQIQLHLERVLGFMPGACRFVIKSEELRDYLEVWIRVDDDLFSDEIKEMEKLSRRLESELTTELGLPLKIRFKEKPSFDSLPTNDRIEDLRDQADYEIL